MCPSTNTNSLLNVKFLRFINSNFTKNDVFDIHANTCFENGDEMEIVARNQFIHVEADPKWSKNVELMVKMYSEFFNSRSF